jgi:glycosyltransferase involved in cell wall biosynthesis
MYTVVKDGENYGKQAKKRLKVLFLADAGNIHTQRWVKYFADKGYYVHLISARSFGGCNIRGVTLHVLRTLPHVRILYFPLWVFLGATNTRKIIRRIKPDVIHAHYVTNYGLIGASSGFHPFVLTTWGSDILVAPRQSRIMNLMVKFVLRKADLVTCDGENMRSELLKFGVAAEKLHLILHGVDTQKFCPLPKNEKLNRELGTSNFPVVISIRNLYPIYNVETLIKAVPLVLKQIPDVKFLIVGEGNQKKYLIDLVRSLNIVENVKFIGHISHYDVPHYLALAEVYVSTSLSDAGASISLLEAMACGISPIITEVGDANEWISDGKNGFIIPVKDPKLLSEKIVYLLKNEEIRQRFGKINRRIVQEKSDYFKEMAKVENLLVKLENTFI